MSAGLHLIGRTIAGRFRITGLIGEGAMAAVYRGEQDEEPRDVAIKIMHPQLLGDATFVTRFRREAKAAARLRHPNTVHIIDSGVDGHLPYIVMELLTGQDLFDLLLVEQRLSEARAARIMLGITDALIAAHQRGIVHRDLKPENVMILKDPDDPSVERVKVLDFGIAKMVEGGARAGDEGPNSAPISVWGSVTTVGVVVGTPAYMSPEQCRGDVIDGRSDVYACGVLLYLLVTGRLPFPPTSVPWEVAQDHVQKPPPAPSLYLPQIHPGLEATILTALAKWPSQRQQSARELRDELERLLPTLSESLSPVGVPGALQDAPTIESPMMPVSVRSSMTVSPPLREVDLPPLREVDVPSLRGVDVPSLREVDLPPPAQRGERLAQALDHSGTIPQAPPSGSSPSRDATPSSGGDRAPDTLATPGMDDIARAPSPAQGSVPPIDPPSSDLEIHDRKALAPLVPALPAHAPAAAGEAPAADLPRRRSRPAPEVSVVAPAPIQRPARRPPPRATDIWLARLSVPLAIVVGLVLGVLAFFLGR